MSGKFISNPEGMLGGIDESILSHNLVEMRSSMMHLVTNESIGGNAGKIEIGGRAFSCAAARGFADAKTGKIIAFIISGVILLLVSFLYQKLKKLVLENDHPTENKIEDEKVS